MSNEKLRLVEWLGYTKLPDFSKSQTLGGIIGGLLVLTVAGAVAMVFSLFVMALFNSSDSDDARNYALILAALLGVPFIIWRAFVAQKQVDIAEQGHMTDRISKAVEQLGAEKSTRDDDHKTQPNLEVRVGAIYALERIAQDSKRDHISVMEILCAYVRNNSPDTDAVTIEIDTEDENWDYKMREKIDAIKTAPIDIQAALSVIGRRKPEHIAFERNPEKNPTKRAYALDLRKTNLQKLDLSQANLDNALLEDARLSGANLIGAQLQGADLSGAQLQGANLSWAQLQGANLSEAQLQGADLTAAHTRLAAVKSTALDDVENLTEDQVKSMFGDASTTLPQNMPPPDWAKHKLDWFEFLDKWHAAKKAANL